MDSAHSRIGIERTSGRNGWTSFWSRFVESNDSFGEDNVGVEYWVAGDDHSEHAFRSFVEFISIHDR